MIIITPSTPTSANSGQETFSKLHMLPPLLLLLLGAANANPAAIQAEADLAEIASFAGRDFADPSTYFDAAESRRASKYLQKARHWQNEVEAGGTSGGDFSTCR